MSLFPQLVAGPIVRYVDVEKEIGLRNVTLDDAFYGVVRFTQGLLKKVVLANYAGSAVSALIGADMSRLGAAGAWLGMLFFSFQIYFDFSGYSDMAIGLGRLFGFNFRENFDYPYVSTSITEFWRRWHIEGLKNLVDKRTGLVKTSFNQTVTSTGRLSSKEPNLQNIPVREEEGRMLRKFFVPSREDGVIIGADYSQIELRLLADFADCQPLIDAFNHGVDIHSATAKKVFKASEVTKPMRNSAKAVNFGIIYGISEYGLAKNLKISAREAKNYIDAYFNEYPEVKEYMQKNVDSAREKGYAITLLGRRRVIREISSANYNLRSFGERAAMNMPLQGSSADIIKLAMLGVHKRLKKEKLQSKLILQVHDELIIDALASEKERVMKILVEEMENAVNLKVKLTVEVEEGKTWFDAK